MANERTQNVIYLEGKKREIFELYAKLKAKKTYLDDLLKKAKDIQKRIEQIYTSKSMKEDYSQMQSLNNELEAIQTQFEEIQTEDIKPIKDAIENYSSEVDRLYDPLSPDKNVIEKMRDEIYFDTNNVVNGLHTFNLVFKAMSNYKSRVNSYVINQTDYRKILKNTTEQIKKDHTKYEIKDGKIVQVVEEYNDPKLEEIVNNLMTDTPEELLEAVKERLGFLKENDKALYEKSKFTFKELIDNLERKVKQANEDSYNVFATWDLKDKLSKSLKGNDISEITSLLQENYIVQKGYTPNKEVKEETLENANNLNEGPQQSSFEETLKKYASFMQNYYANNKGTIGNAHSLEEHKQRRQINDMMKKYINMEIKKSAKNDASVQAGEKDDNEVIEEITNAVNPKDIEELASSDGATLRLAQIMASGVYEKDGQRVRLTRKQRVALSNALAQAVEKKMDASSKNKDKVDKQVVNEIEIER